MNEICSTLKMSKRTLSAYKSQSKATGKTYRELLILSDSDLERLLMPKSPVPQADSRKDELERLAEGYASELKRRHVTYQVVWEEYIRDNPGGYQYTQFKKHLHDYEKRHSYSYHNVYEPGKEWQIDFAGDPLYVTDGKTGEHKPVSVLCCIMPYSGYAFATAMYDTTMENFFHGLNKGLEHLGAVPKVAKSDNMAQWVRKSSRYEPSFTDATDAWCLHNGIIPEACRVRRPRDKGPVEGLVNKTYQYVYSRMRDEVFTSLEALNGRIMELVDTFNSRPSSSRGKSRSETYILEERPVMASLPDTPCRFRFRKEFTVGPSYHVCVGKEQHFYSIPYGKVGQKATVLWDITSVEIYVGNERVATHQRDMTPYGYTTVEAHMPPSHRAYSRSREYNAAAIQRRALMIGSATKWGVDRLLSSRQFPEQSYRSCQGVFSLASRYGEKRVESACGIIRSKGDTFSYSMLRNMLERNLDQADTTVVSMTPANTEVRGAAEYMCI